MDSTGLKRRIAAAIAAALAILRLIPAAAPIVFWLEWLAGGIGTLGVAHAARARTLGIAQMANISAILSVLVVLARLFPQTEFLVPFLATLASLFGVAALIPPRKT